MVARLGSVSAQFHRPRVNPRCVAKSSRFVVSAQGLRRCVAKLHLVRGGEPAEVGEPPAVGHRGHGGVGGSADGARRLRVGRSRLHRPPRNLTEVRTRRHQLRLRNGFGPSLRPLEPLNSIRRLDRRPRPPAWEHGQTLVKLSLSTPGCARPGCRAFYGNLVLARCAHVRVAAFGPTVPVQMRTPRQKV